MACTLHQAAPQIPGQAMITTIPTTIAVAGGSVRSMKIAGRGYRPRLREVIIIVGASPRREVALVAALLPCFFFSFATLYSSQRLKYRLREISDPY